MVIVSLIKLLSLMVFFSLQPHFLLGAVAQPLVNRIGSGGVQSFTDEVERDLPIKKQVPLYIQHSLGNVSIQGWVQDRIRVKIKKRILAATEKQAQTEMNKLDLITLDTAKSFELRVGHARGVDLVSKLRDEKQSQVAVDIEIKAPYQLDLTVVLGEGRELSLQQWKGAIALTGLNSKLRFSRLHSTRPANVNCQNCNLAMTDSHLDGHFLLGNKDVLLRAVEAEHLFIDSTAGEVRLEQTRGNLSVHTTTGRFNSVGHRGFLSFQSDDGGMFLSGLRGDAEAQTQTGQMMIEVEEVKKFLHLDSEKSDIQVTLPTKFEGQLDLSSLRGEVVVQFPVIPNKLLVSETYGPAAPGRVDAIVGNANDVAIHAYSKQGGVRIMRKAPGK